MISVRAPKANAQPAYFARPDGPELQLRVKPELESYDRHEVPSQRRLHHYLDDTLALLRPHHAGLDSRTPLVFASTSACPGTSTCSIIAI